jgi:tight adherence protein B
MAMPLQQIIIFVGVFIAVFSAVALLLSLGSKPKGASKAPDAAYGLGLNARAEVKATPNAPSANDRKTKQEKSADLQKTEVFSSVPWINDKLQDLELGSRLRMLMFQADISWTPGIFILSSTLMFVASWVLLSLTVNSAWLQVGLAAIIGLMPLCLVLLKRSRRFSKFEAGLPEALDLVVSALRAGHSLNAALGLIARECLPPISNEFQICFAEQNYGLELNEALDNLLMRMPLQDLRIAVTAILIQKETGGNLAEVLNKTTEVIRERFRLRRQVKVHTAHGRMSAIVVTVLPIVLLGVLTMMNPKQESVLWTTPMGLHLCAISAGMAVVGALIIQVIVRIEV